MPSWRSPLAAWAPGFVWRVPVMRAQRLARPPSQAKPHLSLPRQQFLTQLQLVVSECGDGSAGQEGQQASAWAAEEHPARVEACRCGVHLVGARS